MAAVHALDNSNSQAMLLDIYNIAVEKYGLDTFRIMAEPGNPPIYDALVAVKPDTLTLGGWATKAGLARNIFNYIKKHGNPTSETLEKLLDVAGVSYAEFDARRAPVRTEVRGGGERGYREVGRAFFGEDEAPVMPHYGSAVGGEYGDVDEHIELTELNLSEALGYVGRPASLAHDKTAYSLTIVGDSMVPRFKPNERVAVSPRSSLSIGDDVIVQLRGPDGSDDRIRMVLIKELVRRTGSYVELRQHNPPVTFQVELRRIAAMHRVTGVLF